MHACMGSWRGMYASLTCRLLQISASVCYIACISSCIIPHGRPGQVDSASTHTVDKRCKMSRAGLLAYFLFFFSPVRYADHKYSRTRPGYCGMHKCADDACLWLERIKSRNKTKCKTKAQWAWLTLVMPQIKAIEMRTNTDTKRVS